MKKGTPKTLIEAIDSGLDAALVSGEYLTVGATKHVKDYLSQAFCAAMISNPECEDILKTLFNKVTAYD